MSSKIKVLVVDDSAVMRRLLSDAIATEPALELAGVASHGGLAIPMIERLAPDVVTLDIEMPHMDGLETLKVIRSKFARLPVIMCSSLTVRGATATMECLSLGASDYVTKPERMSGGEGAIQGLKEILVPKILALCARGTDVSPRLLKAPPDAKVIPRVPVHRGPIDVVAIGCSTGGPMALAEIVASIPEDFPLPMLIVQHMPAMFTRALAERLSTLCPVPVNEAVAGVELIPGTIWVAPGDYHLGVVRDGHHVYLETSQAPRENSCRPSVDVLFRSVANVYGGRVLAVVLTGMGQDGLRGCTQLGEAKAQIIVQDEGTSVVWGMPGFVAKAGLADAILPLPRIGSEIVRRVNASKSAFA